MKEEVDQIQVSAVFSINTFIKERGEIIMKQLIQQYKVVWEGKNIDWCVDIFEKDFIFVLLNEG